MTEGLFSLFALAGLPVVVAGGAWIGWRHGLPPSFWLALWLAVVAFLAWTQLMGDAQCLLFGDCTHASWLLGGP